jgi:hypothetical protein
MTVMVVAVVVFFVGPWDGVVRLLVVRLVRLVGGHACHNT